MSSEHPIERRLLKIIRHFRHGRCMKTKYNRIIYLRSEIFQRCISFQIVKNRWKMCLQMCMNRYVVQKYRNFWEINEQHQTHKATQQTINRFHP